MRISRRELFAGLLGSLAVSSRPEAFLIYPGVKVGSWTRELPPGPMIRYCADPGAGVAPGEDPKETGA